MGSYLLPSGSRILKSLPDTVIVSGPIFFTLVLTKTKVYPVFANSTCVTAASPYLYAIPFSAEFTVTCCSEFWAVPGRGTFTGEGTTDSAGGITLNLVQPSSSNGCISLAFTVSPNRYVSRQTSQAWQLTVPS